MADYQREMEVDIVYAVPEYGWPIVELKDHPPVLMADVFLAAAGIVRAAMGIMVIVSAAAFLLWILNRL